MAKKPRNKAYRPKAVTPNSALLMKLPLSPDTAKRLTSKTVNGLLRMRLGEKNMHDMLGAVIFFGVAWMAADRMTATDELRDVFGRAIIALEDDLKTSGPLLPETFDQCSDASQLVFEVLKRISTIEYIEYAQKLKNEGVLPLVDQVLNEIEEKGRKGLIVAGEAPVFQA